MEVQVTLQRDKSTKEISTMKEVGISGLNVSVA